MFQLVRKYLGSKKVQSISVVISVVISVAVIFALILSYSGVSKGVDTSSKRIGADVIAMPAGASTSLDAGDLLFTGAYACYYMDESVIEDIKKIPGVETVSAQFYSETLAEEDCCSDGLEARVIGFDPESDWVINPWLQETGRKSLADDEVYIGSKVVEEADGTLAILGRTFKVVGRLDETGTSFDQSILMNLDVSRDLVKNNSSYAGLWKKYGQPDTLITAVLVKVQDGKDVDAVGKMIAYNTGCDVVMSTETLETVLSQTNTVFSLMIVVSILLVIASIVQLIGRFYTMVWDRKTEFGLYRALGSTRKDLRKMVFGEMSLLVGIGTIVGLILGFIFYEIVCMTVLADSGFPFIAPTVLESILFAVAIIVAMFIIGMISIAMPLSQIGKISPMLSINKTTVD